MSAESGALTRRRFLKMSAAGGVAAVGMGGAGDVVPSATGGAEAIDCGGLCVALNPVVAAGWLLRESGVLGADSPADGLSGGALENELLSTVETRKSTNKSTIIDNKNIVESGLENTLYGDGKVAAIEALNDGKTQSEVETAATNAVDSHAITVEKNLLKSWNESVNELESLYNAVDSHADLTVSTLIDVSWSNSVGGSNDGSGAVDGFGTETATLVDGSSFEVRSVQVSSISGGSGFYDVTGDESDYPNASDIWVVVGGGTHSYLRHSAWGDVYDTMQTAITNARDGVILWVENIYSQVQSGELNTEDLLTSRELAAMTADQEDYNQAIADLMALNVSVDLEREAEIHIPSDDVTLTGSLAVTQDTTLNTGTIDPTADSMDYYFTYDVSQGEGVWSDYAEGVDGGVVTFTSEPYQGTEFDITTTAGETATVSASAFSETDAGGEWTADISGQLETVITNIDSVAMYSETSETEYQTIQLEESFEIVTFTDSEGNEYDSAEHSSNQPHDDTNYITEDEWQQREKRYEDLIDKYEESQNSGDGGGGLLDGEGNIGAGAAIAVVAAIFGLGALSN